MSSVTPYRFARLSSLILSFSFGIVGLGLCINSLVKSGDDKDRLRRSAPNGATIDIDTNDAFDSGVVVAVASGLVALASLLSFPGIMGSKRFSSPRGLNFQSAFLAFCTVFLFACLVPFTDFVANREAKVTAFIGNLPVPEVIIQQVEGQLGVTPVYKHIKYCA